MKTIRVLGALMGVVLFSAHARAEESAAEISRKSKERGSLNLVGLTAELKLTTTGKDGASKVQVLTTSSKKIDDRNHSLARFSSPPGVAGVAVLTQEGKGDAPDDILLYFPKLKRVRKVAQGQRGQSFMDTDFSYADLGATGAEEKGLKRLEDVTIDGRSAYVLSGTAGEESPYGDVIVFVDKETYVPVKAEYKDKSGKPFKLYRALKLKKFKERTLASEAVMENLQSGSSTKVEILKLEDSKLGDEAFTERALERG